MQEASVVGFLRTILIIIGIYYAIKFLARLFMPFLMRKMIQKAEKNFQEQQQFYTNQQQQKSDSNSKTKKQAPATKKVGEYIDFEEIE